MMGWGLLMGFVAASATSPRWQVDRWTMRHGLPQNSVNDILQDHGGDIWVATFGGIARFDGIDFRHFTPANAPGLDANRFTSVAQSPDSVLWFGSEHRGAFRFAEGRFERVGPRVMVTDLQVDGDGRVWGATPRAFVELSAIPPREIPVPRGRLRTLARLANGQVVGSGHDMPWRCATPPVECLDDVPKGVTSALDRLGQDREGRLWLHALHGVYHLDRDSRSWIPDFRTEVQSVLPGFSFVWQRDRWFVYEGRLKAVTATADSLPTPQRPIRSHLVDREGGLWLGLDGGGLWRIDRSSAIVHSPQQPVRTVARDGSDTLWTGTCSNRVVRIGAPIPPLPGRHAWPRCARVWGDGQGGVYTVAERFAESADASVLHFQGDQWRPLLTVPVAPPQRYFVPHTGPWFVHDEVLYALPTDAVRGVKQVTSADEVGGTRLRPIHAPREGELWASLDDDELLLLRNGTPIRRIELAGTAPVRDLVERGDRLWISTYGTGLLGVEGNTVVGRLTPQRGMCDYALSRLFDTGDGELWVNTNRGLGRLREAELREAMVDPTVVVSCHIVDSGEANGAGGVLAEDGRVWAPTVAGLVELDTRRAVDLAPPRVVVREARLGGTDLLVGDSAQPVAVRGPNPLSIRFAGLQFRDPRAVRYRYRLLGRDATWSAPTTARTLHWEALPPDAYRFEVQAIGASGAPSPIAGVSFVRKPEVWETGWFRVGLPLGLLGSIAFGSWAAWYTTERHNAALQAEIRIREAAEDELLREQEIRERAQQALHDSRRLQAIGRLAGGIAHDFNNLLTIVASHASQLEEHDDDDVRQAAHSLEATVDRAATLTRRLLVVGGNGPIHPEHLELGRALEHFVPLLRRLIRETIALAIEVDEPVWVAVDRGRLDQIVTNLVVNARDAIDGSGTIAIRVGARDDDWVELSVQDDGVGIQTHKVAHLFEPYFTTKTPSRGTGLGLATVQGAVVEAGGRIEVHTELGFGTTMTVLLPRLPPAATNPPPPEPAPAESVDESLAVLLVDDQRDVARSLGRLVKSLGWTTYLASTLDEALQILDQTAVDVLVTDVVMPGASGPEVAAAARTDHPELAVVFMSGHTDGVLDALDDELRDAPLLRKPFRRDDLLEAVKMALRNPRR